MVDVLIVGSGAREHALAWKLKQSPRLGKLYIAPGNAGTMDIAENVPIVESDIKNLAIFAERNKIGLTIVGPDNPLSLGIVDFFRSHRLRIFGPTKAAAQIESSKVFAKQLMHEANIPTAEYRVFSDHGAALGYVRAHKAPIVIKASGLSFGKGVYVCQTLEEAEQALQAIMIDKVHGDSGKEVVVEEFLKGPEISVHALSDGYTFVMFPPSQDHKRALEGDMGSNTGGMGTIAPTPWAPIDIMHSIESRVVGPALEAMVQRKEEFSGLLYPGIIRTVEGPKVLEFNARFGDPETQVYMRLLKTDLLDLLEACTDHTLVMVKDAVQWERAFAVNIVLASGGYPEKYETGYPITGIQAAEKIPGVVVFHGGTKFDGDLRTAGGRVLSVSALAMTLKDAMTNAYKAVECIHFEGMQFRRDIGRVALEYYTSIRV